MFKVNDFLIYKKDVCKVKEIFTYEPKNITYYALVPIDDLSLTISVPVDTKLIRPIISKKEVEQIIESIPNINPIDNINDKMIEQEYKSLFNSGTMEDLIRIIKTAYTRNDNRLKDNKKISERDDNYFKKAEKLLYNEFAVALNKSYEETKAYVTKQVEKNTK